MDVVLGLGEGAALGHLQRRGRGEATSARSSAILTAATTSACSRTSSTSRRPTSTPASGSSSPPRAGTMCRSRPPCAPRRRCRWSTPPSRVRAASSSTAASSRRRTSTSRSRPAEFIVVVNPLVPFVNDFSKPRRRPVRFAPAAGQRHGVPQIGYQTFKLMAYQRLHEMARRWEERYLGVDIVLIEPVAQPRADVPDVDHGLRRSAWRSPSTASSR